MSDDDNLPDLSGPLPLDLSKVEITPAHNIPTTEFIWHGYLSATFC